LFFLDSRFPHINNRDRGAGPAPSRDTLATLKNTVPSVREDIVKSVLRVDTWARVGLATSVMVCLISQGQAAAEGGAGIDGASPVAITECFQTVQSDAVLAHDLVCEAHGLSRAAIEIVASNVTVDLGGHTLFGYPFGQLGIRADGFDGVTVKNGTIDGFVFGMTFAAGSDLTAEDLTIRNLEIEDPGEWVAGVWLNDCQDAVTRNAKFEFLPTAHKSAVEAWKCSGFRIDAIALPGGGLGVEINFGSTGEVVNSRFVGLKGAGVLIEGSHGARIAHNEFVRNEWGIAASSYDPEPITGLTIEANSIEDGNVGVSFQGISDSTVRGNIVRNCSRGISLEPYQSCQDPPPGTECYYSTGNVIMENTVVGNYIDLYHHEACVPNTWEWNICRTKDGAEIPSCTRYRRGPGSRLEP